MTPRLNYVKYFEKPALHYWLTAASFAAFGQNEAAARLFPVLFGLKGCLDIGFVQGGFRVSPALFQKIRRIPAHEMHQPDHFFLS